MEKTKQSNSAATASDNVINEMQSSTHWNLDAEDFVPQGLFLFPSAEVDYSGIAHNADHQGVEFGYANIPMMASYGATAPGHATSPHHMYMPFPQGGGMLGMPDISQHVGASVISPGLRLPAPPGGGDHQDTQQPPSIGGGNSAPHNGGAGAAAAFHTPYGSLPATWGVAGEGGHIPPFTSSGGFAAPRPSISGGFTNISSSSNYSSPLLPLVTNGGGSPAVTPYVNTPPIAGGGGPGMMGGAGLPNGSLHTSNGIANTTVGGNSLVHGIGGINTYGNSSFISANHTSDSGIGGGRSRYGSFHGGSHTHLMHYPPSGPSGHHHYHHHHHNSNSNSGSSNSNTNHSNHHGHHSYHYVNNSSNSSSNYTHSHALGTHHAHNASGKAQYPNNEASQAGSVAGGNAASGTTSASPQRVARSLHTSLGELPTLSAGGMHTEINVSSTASGSSSKADAQVSDGAATACGKATTRTAVGESSENATLVASSSAAVSNPYSSSSGGVLGSNSTASLVQVQANNGLSNGLSSDVTGGGAVTGSSNNGAVSGGSPIAHHNSHQYNQPHHGGAGSHSNAGNQPLASGGSGSNSLTANLPPSSSSNYHNSGSGSIIHHRSGGGSSSSSSRPPRNSHHSGQHTASHRGVGGSGHDSLHHQQHYHGISSSGGGFPRNSRSSGSRHSNNNSGGHSNYHQQHHNMHYSNSGGGHHHQQQSQQHHGRSNNAQNDSSQSGSGSRHYPSASTSSHTYLGVVSIPSSRGTMSGSHSNAYFQSYAAAYMGHTGATNAGSYQHVGSNSGHLQGGGLHAPSMGMLHTLPLQQDGVPKGGKVFVSQLASQQNAASSSVLPPSYPYDASSSGGDIGACADMMTHPGSEHPYAGDVDEEAARSAPSTMAPNFSSISQLSSQEIFPTHINSSGGGLAYNMMPPQYPHQSFPLCFGSFGAGNELLLQHQPQGDDVLYAQRDDGVPCVGGSVGMGTNPSLTAVPSANTKIAAPQQMHPQLVDAAGNAALPATGGMVHPSTAAGGVVFPMGAAGSPGLIVDHTSASSLSMASAGGLANDIRRASGGEQSSFIHGENCMIAGAPLIDANGLVSLPHPMTTGGMPGVINPAGVDVGVTASVEDLPPVYGVISGSPGTNPLIIAPPVGGVATSLVSSASVVLPEVSSLRQAESSRAGNTVLSASAAEFSTSSQLMVFPSPSSSEQADAAQNLTSSLTPPDLVDGGATKQNLRNIGISASPEDVSPAFFASAAADDAQHSTLVSTAGQPAAGENRLEDSKYWRFQNAEETHKKDSSNANRSTSFTATERSSDDVCEETNGISAASKEESSSATGSASAIKQKSDSSSIQSKDGFVSKLSLDAQAFVPSGMQFLGQVPHSITSSQRPEFDNAGGFEVGYDYSIGVGNSAGSAPYGFDAGNSMGHLMGGAMMDKSMQMRGRHPHTVVVGYGPNDNASLMSLPGANLSSNPAPGVVFSTAVAAKGSKFEGGLNTFSAHDGKVGSSALQQYPATTGEVIPSFGYSAHQIGGVRADSNARTDLNTHHRKVGARKTAGSSTGSFSGGSFKGSSNGGKRFGADSLTGTSTHTATAEKHQSHRTSETAATTHTASGSNEVSSHSEDASQGVRGSDSQHIQQTSKHDGVLGSGEPHPSSLTKGGGALAGKFGAASREGFKRDSYAEGSRMGSKHSRARSPRNQSFFSSIEDPLQSRGSSFEAENEAVGGSRGYSGAAAKDTENQGGNAVSANDGYAGESLRNGGPSRGVSTSGKLSAGSTKDGKKNDRKGSPEGVVGSNGRLATSFTVDKSGGSNVGNNSALLKNLDHSQGVRREDLSNKRGLVATRSGSTSRSAGKQGSEDTSSMPKGKEAFKSRGGVGSSGGSLSNAHSLPRGGNHAFSNERDAAPFSGGARTQHMARRDGSKDSAPYLNVLTDPYVAVDSTSNRATGARFGGDSSEEADSNSLSNSPPLAPSVTVERRRPITNSVWSRNGGRKGFAYSAEASISSSSEALKGKSSVIPEESGAHMISSQGSGGASRAVSASQDATASAGWCERRKADDSQSCDQSTRFPSMLSEESGHLLSDAASAYRHTADQPAKQLVSGDTSLPGTPATAGDASTEASPEVVNAGSSPTESGASSEKHTPDSPVRSINDAFVGAQAASAAPATAPFRGLAPKKSMMKPFGRGGGLRKQFGAPSATVKSSPGLQSVALTAVAHSIVTSGTTSLQHPITSSGSSSTDHTIPTSLPGSLEGVKVGVENGFARGNGAAVPVIMPQHSSSSLSLVCGPAVGNNGIEKMLASHSDISFGVVGESHGAKLVQGTYLYDDLKHVVNFSAISSGAPHDDAYNGQLEADVNGVPSSTPILEDNESLMASFMNPTSLIKGEKVKEPLKRVETAEAASSALVSDHVTAGAKASVGESSSAVAVDLMASNSDEMQQRQTKDACVDSEAKNTRAKDAANAVHVGVEQVNDVAQKDEQREILKETQEQSLHSNVPSKGVKSSKASESTNFHTRTEGTGISNYIEEDTSLKKATQTTKASDLSTPKEPSGISPVKVEKVTSSSQASAKTENKSVFVPRMLKKMAAARESTTIPGATATSGAAPPSAARKPLGSGGSELNGKVSVAEHRHMGLQGTLGRRKGSAGGSIATNTLSKSGSFREELNDSISREFEHAHTEAAAPSTSSPQVGANVLKDPPVPEVKVNDSLPSSAIVKDASESKEKTTFMKMDAAQLNEVGEQVSATDTVGDSHSSSLTASSAATSGECLASLGTETSSSMETSSQTLSTSLNVSSAASSSSQNDVCSSVVYSSKDELGQRPTPTASATAMKSEDAVTLSSADEHPKVEASATSPTLDMEPSEGKDDFEGSWLTDSKSLDMVVSGEADSLQASSGGNYSAEGTTALLSSQSAETMQQEHSAASEPFSNLQADEAAAVNDEITDDLKKQEVDKCVEKIGAVPGDKDILPKAEDMALEEEDEDVVDGRTSSDNAEVNDEAAEVLKGMDVVSRSSDFDGSPPPDGVEAASKPTFIPPASRIYTRELLLDPVIINAALKMPSSAVLHFIMTPSGGAASSYMRRRGYDRSLHTSAASSAVARNFTSTERGFYFGESNPSSFMSVDQQNKNFMSLINSSISSSRMNMNLSASFSLSSPVSAYNSTQLGQQGSTPLSQLSQDRLGSNLAFSTFSKSSQNASARSEVADESWRSTRQPVSSAAASDAVSLLRKPVDSLTSSSSMEPIDSKMTASRWRNTIDESAKKSTALSGFFKGRPQKPIPGREDGVGSGSMEPAAAPIKVTKFKKATDATSQKVRALNLLLNKLTIERFEYLTSQILEIVFEDLELLRPLASLVFEKAATQHHFVEMYAKLCVQVDVATAVEGKSVFKGLVLAECQSSFEANLKPMQLKIEGTGAVAEFEAQIKYKKKMNGVMLLVSELLKVKLLSHALFQRCIHELLTNRKACIELSQGKDQGLYYLEALSVFLNSTGPTFLSPISRVKDDVAVLLDEIYSLCFDDSLDFRTRCLLKNVFDDYGNHWAKQKEAKEQGPRTLKEIFLQFYGGDDEYFDGFGGERRLPQSSTASNYMMSNPMAKGILRSNSSLTTTANTSIPKYSKDKIPPPSTSTTYTPTVVNHDEAVPQEAPQLGTVNAENKVEAANEDSDVCVNKDIKLATAEISRGESMPNLDNVAGTNSSTVADSLSFALENVVTELYQNKDLSQAIESCSKLNVENQNHGTAWLSCFKAILSDNACTIDQANLAFEMLLSVVVEKVLLPTLCKESLRGFVTEQTGPSDYVRFRNGNSTVDRKLRSFVEIAEGNELYSSWIGPALMDDIKAV